MTILSLLFKRPARVAHTKDFPRQISSFFPGVVAGVALVAALCTGGCGYTGANDSASPLKASSTQVEFGNVAVGSTTAQLVTLTATGTANVVIKGVTVTGNAFSTSNQSGITLTPDQSVTVSVNFEPTKAGTDTGKLNIATNSYPVQIALSGTGVTGGQHSVALNWQATPAVIGYYVYRGSSVSSESKVSSTLDPNTSYTDTSVTNGQTYIYSVTSVDASYVESPRSNPVSVTIPN